MVFGKAAFSKCFQSTQKCKAGVLKNVFEKLCFPDISMWKVGLTTRKKAVFLNFSDVAWRGALENVYYIHGGASSES